MPWFFAVANRPKKIVIEVNMSPFGRNGYWLCDVDAWDRFGEARNQTGQASLKPLSK
jgi:hypothetical protein